MTKFIKSVCTECGPRRPASDAERKCQDMVRAECEAFADEVKVDEFTCAYNAYPQGLVRVAIGLFTIGFVTCITIVYPIMIVLGILALWVVVSELMIMLEFTDLFYKKDTSHNVFGVIKPRAETKLRIIFGGHTDSAYEIPFAKKYGIKISTLMIIAIAYGAIGVALEVTKLVLDLFGNGMSINLWSSGFFRITIIDAIFLVSCIVGYPYMLWIGKNCGSRKTKVLGANDNLSGVSVALALGQYLKEHRPNNVEVWTGAFGCEEAGQRGSRRFVEKHGADGTLDNSYTVVIESIGAGMGYGILSAEKMYLTWPGMKPVFHSKELVDKFFASCENYARVKKAVPYFIKHEATFAGTDATRFSQKGYKAIAIGAGGTNLFIENWHDHDDTPENINKLMLWHALNFCATFVDDMDKEMTG
ncbi:MAG TPA: M20/M25/M40 family metallo-hydrolase [Candidatus Lokiarchaeia archaeon]|nr:M20/M25/M40 family metallo-hydrolase [Candidatus Lokiarchaeia archaeon]